MKLSEAVNQRTYNTIANRKKAKKTNKNIQNTTQKAKY